MNTQEIYNFNPKVKIEDFCKAVYTTFKNIYKDIIMVSCLFHFLQRLILHLPQYKDFKIITLDYFKNKDEYAEKGNKITRAIYLYIKKIYNGDKLPLLTHKDMSIIIDNYNNNKKDVIIIIYNSDDDLNVINHIK